MSLKNKYFAIIYSGCVKGDGVRKIHKALYDATINSGKYSSKILLAQALKLTNKAKKVVPSDGELLSVAIFSLFKRDDVNDTAKKIINWQTQRDAEKEKDATLKSFIEENQKDGKWFYLASSHDDCAKDHLDWQGKLYVDENAPEEVLEYAKSRALHTMQWVIGQPVWFITRPNCRHYFVSLSESEVRKKPLKKLKRKYKTHTKEGDRQFQTPAHAAVEEYEDRLHMLRALYRESPNPVIKKEIEKAELLVKKWKREI